jgi:hypothetical protein
MHEFFIYAILFLAPLAFGFGMATLMLWLFDVVLRSLPVADTLKNLGKVLGWFVGNGSVVFGMFKVFDLSKNLEISDATGIALLAYLLGFGTGTAYVVLRKPPSLLQDLHRFLSQDELEVVLLISRYNIDPTEVATALHMTKDEIDEIFQAALEKLSQRGERFIQELSKKRPPKKR